VLSRVEFGAAVRRDGDRTFDAGEDDRQPRRREGALVATVLPEAAPEAGGEDDERVRAPAYGCPAALRTASSAASSALRLVTGSGAWRPAS
jgi:hypothetical protein